MGRGCISAVSRSPVQAIQAAITRHRLGGLRTVIFSHDWGGWTFKIKVLVDWVSGESLLPGS